MPQAISFYLDSNFGKQLSSRQRHALRKQSFLAPQTPPLPPRQRVVTTVLAGRLPQWSLLWALVSLVKPADPQAAFAVLARFELQDKQYARVDRLSGGERQRRSMARLLLSEASLLLVDEPLSTLDPSLMRHLAALQQEAAVRQAELARDCFARIIGLRDDRIVFDAPRELVSDAMIAALYGQRDTAGANEASQPPFTDLQAEAAKADAAARC